MASNPPSSVGITLSGLTDRDGCIDAVLRFIQGMDDNEPEILKSAFTEDIVFNMAGIATSGLNFPNVSGRDNLVAHVGKGVGPMDTYHNITNFRVHVESGTAKLQCYSLAQHHRTGEGPKADKVGCLMGNRIKAELVKADDGLWKMSKVWLSCSWVEGDLSVMTG